MGEVDALSGDHSISSSFTSGSALGTGAFLPVGKAHQMTGLDEWVAEAASQRNLPVPQGKQRLDDLLSESEHYAVKNPEEIQIHPVRTSTLLLSLHRPQDDLSTFCACFVRWGTARVLNAVKTLRRR